MFANYANYMFFSELISSNFFKLLFSYSVMSLNLSPTLHHLLAAIKFQ